MNTLLLKNPRIIDPETNRDEVTDVLIEGEKIAQIGQNLTSQEAEVIDLTGKVLIPGMIDLHVHLRDLDQSYKETIESGTLAALKGGVTTVFAMPNTQPALDNKETIAEYQKRIQENAHVRVHVIGAITKGLKSQELADLDDYSSLGIKMISDDGFDVESDELLEQAYQKAKELGLILVTHPEMHNIAPDGVINEGEISQKLNLPGQPNEKEWKAVERGIRLAKKTGARAHFTHLTTEESVQLIREAKKETDQITCDATPHHFSLTDKAVLEKGSLAKVNPPLRSEDDQWAIIQGLQDGTIDLIATDHAPHAEEEKTDDIKTSAFGFSQLDTAIPSIITELHFNQGIPLLDIVKLITHAPAKLAGLKEGRLQEGAPANLVALDLENNHAVERMSFVSKGKNSPFEGVRLRGWPIMTIFQGLRNKDKE